MFDDTHDNGVVGDMLDGAYPYSDDPRDSKEYMDRHLEDNEYIQAFVSELGAETLGYAEFWSAIEELREQINVFLNLAQIYIVEHDDNATTDMIEIGECVFRNLMNLCEALGLCEVHEIVVTSEKGD